MNSFKFQLLHFKYAFVLLGLMLLASCNDGKYEIRGNQVYYTWWTFSFGHQDSLLIGADADSFEEIEDWLGRDKNHVWYEARLVEGCDPQTVKAVKKGLFCDKKDYYFEGAPLHVKDMATFEVVAFNEYCLWAKDSKCGYYDSTRLEGIDSKTFKTIDTFVAKDKYHVYYFGKVLPQADPETFEVMDGAGYMKDKANVWYMDSIMPGVEAKNAESEWSYAWDSKHAWYNGQLLKGADGKTFEVLKSGYYAKDAKHVWYHDEIVKGADAASFKDDGEMQGHDKNQKYVCERIYDLDD
ncbi:MAG: DKNYY domain-containing protein [Bacteroidaceae bacterium]|nr:DKNYY domain-containing protein [Bacteroidaceae bacterium]